MCAKNYTIPVFIPFLACPFHCIYCDQQKISGEKLIPDEKEITEKINTYLSTIPNQDAHIEVGFFGGTFTGMEIARQEKFLQTVQPFLEKGIVRGIRISTRPDYINREVLRMLKTHKVTAIELGAQSLQKDVLKLSGRGHSVEQIAEAAKLIKNLGFTLGLQMMTGLPGDSLPKAIASAHKIIELGADNTRIYPTLVIKGTKLASLYADGKYTPLTIEETVKWLAELLVIFEKANVNVLRIGLHPSEGLLSGKDLIAGPFHPSMRELVLTEIWKRKLEKIDVQTEGLNIAVSPKQINYAIGYDGKNKKLLQKKYKKLRFTTNEKIQNRDFQIQTI